MAEITFTGAEGAGKLKAFLDDPETPKALKNAYQGLAFQRMIPEALANGSSLTINYDPSDQDAKEARLNIKLDNTTYSGPTKLLLDGVGFGQEITLKVENGKFVSAPKEAAKSQTQGTGAPAEQATPPKAQNPLSEKDALQVLDANIAQTTDAEQQQAWKDMRALVAEAYKEGAKLGSTEQGGKGELDFTEIAAWASAKGVDTKNKFAAASAGITKDGRGLIGVQVPSEPTETKEEPTTLEKFMKSDVAKFAGAAAGFAAGMALGGGGLMGVILGILFALVGFAAASLFDEDSYVSKKAGLGPKKNTQAPGKDRAQGTNLDAPAQATEPPALETNKGIVDFNDPKIREQISASKDASLSFVIEGEDGQPTHKVTGKYDGKEFKVSTVAAVLLDKEGKVIRDDQNNPRYAEPVTVTGVAIDSEDGKVNLIKNDPLKPYLNQAREISAKSYDEVPSAVIKIPGQDNPNRVQSTIGTYTLNGKEYKVIMFGTKEGDMMLAKTATLRLEGADGKLLLKANGEPLEVNVNPDKALPIKTLSGSTDLILTKLQQTDYIKKIGDDAAAAYQASERTRAAEVEAQQAALNDQKATLRSALSDPNPENVKANVKRFLENSKPFGDLGVAVNDQTRIRSALSDQIADILIGESDLAKRGKAINKAMQDKGVSGAAQENIRTMLTSLDLASIVQEPVGTPSPSPSPSLTASTLANKPKVTIGGTEYGVSGVRTGDKVTSMTLTPIADDGTPITFDDQTQDGKTLLAKANAYKAAAGSSSRDENNLRDLVETALSFHTTRKWLAANESRLPKINGTAAEAVYINNATPDDTLQDSLQVGYKVTRDNKDAVLKALNSFGLDAKLTDEKISPRYAYFEPKGELPKDFNKAILDARLAVSKATVPGNGAEADKTWTLDEMRAMKDLNIDFKAILDNQSSPVTLSFADTVAPTAVGAQPLVNNVRGNSFGNILVVERTGSTDNIEVGYYNKETQAFDFKSFTKPANFDINTLDDNTMATLALAANGVSSVGTRINVVGVGDLTYKHNEQNKMMADELQKSPLTPFLKTKQTPTLP